MIGTFPEDYRVVRKLIDGSASKVYICEKSDKRYICKRINSLNFRKEEMENANAIRTDRVIDILEHCQMFNGLGTYHYLFMDYYPGTMDVFDYVCEKTVTEKELKPFIKEMCLAIKDCHDNGIVHLDIKGENFIIVSHDPLKLKLIDFGASHRVEESGSIKRYFGTIMYCSPEIKKKRFFLSSDVWSLGAWIYYVLTDKYTFEKEKINTEYYIDKEHGFSDNLKKLLVRMMHYDPKKRLTIEEVLNDPWFCDDVTTENSND